MAPVADFTELLLRWSEGDQQAFEELIPIAYDELKRIAQKNLTGERHADTLNCTALVHEAYLRLADQDRMHWKGRAHFFGAAAQVMRRLLIEHARKRLAEKRGGGGEPVALDDLTAVALAPDLDALDLDRALTALAETDAESARVVELRCFGGLSIEETAEVLGTSPSSVTRMWSFARAWLYRYLNRVPVESPS
ncbi:MAG: sigma-70 family RNA polymerase sigma factor [Acidobacteriota bacterium]